MAGPRRDILKTTHDIFVNRDGPIRMIKRAVSELGNADSKVLVFYGPRRPGQNRIMPIHERNICL